MSSETTGRNGGLRCILTFSMVAEENMTYKLIQNKIQTSEKLRFFFIETKNLIEIRCQFTEYLKEV